MGKTIGGTAISAILGINPYKSAFDVWLDIKKKAEPIKDNEPMYWGRAFEEPIARAFQERNAPFIVKEPPMLVHPKYEFLTGSPDRYIYKDNKLVAGLEIKTASIYVAHKWGDEDTDTIPDEYKLQCQWYMGLSGMTDWYVAAVIGGNNYRQYLLKFDKDLFDTMVDVAVTFWNDFILGDKSPELMPSEQSINYLKKLHPKETKPLKIVDSDDELFIVENFKQARENEANAEKELENAKILLINLIQDSEGVTGSFGSITYKKSKDSIKVDYESLCKELNPSSDLLEKYTTTKQGSRVIRPTFKIK